MVFDEVNEIVLKNEDDDQYPPPHLRPTGRRHVSALPLLAMTNNHGDVEAAIHWEDLLRAWDIADHHHHQYVIEHKFGGNAEAYVAYLKVFGERYQRNGEPIPMDFASIPGDGQIVRDLHVAGSEPLQPGGDPNAGSQGQRGA